MTENASASPKEKNMPAISWDDAIRRIGNGEPVLDVLDEKAATDREDFRSFLADIGGKGAAALVRYDAAMRDLDSGVTGARSAWHSISPAQRRALLEAADGKQPTAGIKTLRNLARRDLLAWDGGAFTPEARVVITERGQFVIRHGQHVKV